MVDNDCIAGDGCISSVCTACASGYNQPCGSCGGVNDCNGNCTVPTPSNYGQSCGSCGGTIECDGVTCSVATPSNLGGFCTSHVHCPCGYTLSGTIDCSGACVPDCSCCCSGGKPC
jgi:hypothetical protein